MVARAREGSVPPRSLGRKGADLHGGSKRAAGAPSTLAALHALIPVVCHGAIDARSIALSDDGTPTLFGFHHAAEALVPPSAQGDLRALGATLRPYADEVEPSLQALLDDLRDGRIESAALAESRLDWIERGPRKMSAPVRVHAS